MDHKNREKLTADDGTGRPSRKDAPMPKQGEASNQAPCEKNYSSTGEYVGGAEQARVNKAWKNSNIHRGERERIKSVQKDDVHKDTKDRC